MLFRSVGIRRIENKTAVEVGLYDNKGEVGKIVSQLLERAKIDIKDYTVSFITRAQNSILYTGGSKAHDGLDTTFFLILRPLDKTVSLCKLDQAKADCISSDGAPDTVETLPPDVLLSIENITQGQQLVIKGKRYMREYNLENLYISQRRGETLVVITDGIAGSVAPIFTDFQGQGLLVAATLTDDVVVALTHLRVTGRQVSVGCIFMDFVQHIG